MLDAAYVWTSEKEKKKKVLARDSVSEELVRKQYSDTCH